MNFRTLIARAMGTGAGFFLAAVTVFAANVVLSNLLDADGYGSVVLMITWATIAAQLAQLGFMRGATKIVSTARSEDAPGTVRAFLVFVTAAVAAAAVPCGLVLSGAIHALTPQEATFRTLAAAAGLLLWPLSMCRVSSGVMLGLSRGLTGAFFQNGLPHLGILIGVGVLAAWPGPIGPGAAVPAILAGAWAAALAAAGFAAWTARDAWKAPRGPFQAGPWLALALPLMMIGMAQLLNRQAGTIIVGALGSAEDVAAYFPAIRISEFSTFGLVAVNAAVASRLAAAHGRRDRGLMQSTLTRAAVLTLATTLALVGATLVLEETLLGLFGGPAARADTALRILLIGQVVNAATGSVGILMAMAGQERFAATTAFVVLAVNVALHMALVPPFGIEGAAVATAGSSVLWNLLLLWRAVRGLAVNPTIFSAHVVRLFRRRAGE